MNNPPAFPRQLPNVEYTPEDAARILSEHQGMTLRDYFAAAALQGMCANHEFTSDSYKSLAEKSWYQADAMLKAREHLRKMRCSSDTRTP